MDRREFVKKSAVLTGVASTGLPNLFANETFGTVTTKLEIAKSVMAFEREPLLHTYGFKGGYITNLWQVAAKMYGTGGEHVIGLGVQSPLWADWRVDARWGETGSSAVMFNVAAKAAHLIAGNTFDSPMEMIEAIWPEVHQYAMKITEIKDLRETFSLNALVAIDNAAWLQYARQNGISSFDDLVPAQYRESLSHRHGEVASLPSVSYSTSKEDLETLLEEGYFVLKIKIGAPGAQKTMLRADMDRMTFVHDLVSRLEARLETTGRMPGRMPGRIVYSLDANGRYESKDAFKRLLDHCRSIGAYDRMILVEDPFVTTLETDVSDIDIRLAADETAHTDRDALERIQMGYRAMALKPAAKTLSMTIKIIQLAHENNIPCFCTDLTVNPVLVDWNKTVAARLAPIPGLKAGLLETNGHQNYRNWEQMIGYHPYPEASWIHDQNGVFKLDNSFYKESAGMFGALPHYEGLFPNV